MNKFSVIFFGLLTSCFVITQALAKAPEPSIPADQIRVYATPDGKRLIKALPGDAVLIPIYRKAGWCEVGDPETGKVGWVSTAQVRQARHAFYRPDIKTVYINTDRSAQGKPRLNIVAYINGAKVSPDQAKRIYKNIRKQQQNQLRHLRMMFGWVDKEFINDFHAFLSPPLILLPPAKDVQIDHPTSQDQRAERSAVHHPGKVIKSDEDSK